MRRGMAGAAAVLGVVLACGPARADWVPPFKGNDTGGIISYSLVGQADVRAMAVDHCARYGKVVRLTGVQATYGGYLSFACIWAPPGRSEHTLSVRY